MNTQFTNTGQTLIETVVIVGLVVFVLVAVVAGLVIAIKNSGFSNNQAVATKYAQETIEQFQSQRQQLGWESFYEILSVDGNEITYCLSEGIASSEAFDNLIDGACEIDETIEDTPFIRQAEVVVHSTEEISVTSTVEWSEADQNKQAHVVHTFYQWK